MALRLIMRWRLLLDGSELVLKAESFQWKRDSKAQDGPRFVGEFGQRAE